MRLQTVHLRVNDHTTGQPTACRVRISDASGQEYAPFGQPLEFSTHRGEHVGGHLRLPSGRWYSIPGQCEIALPAGQLRAQIRKGLDYPPVDERIELLAGKKALRFTIRRENVTLKPQAMSIDTRCHFLSPHDAALDAAAEDMDVVNVLAQPLEVLGHNGEAYTSVPNLNAFSGQTPSLTQHDAQVFVNTHNRHCVFGSLGLLNSHRPVFPLTFGSPDDTDDWSLRDWAGQCHRKGGLVVWTEPFAPNKPHAGEALALAVLGEIDAYELTPDHLPAALRGWYNLLNAGVRLPIVGGSGRVNNTRPLGAMQTIDFVPEINWVDSIKLGYTKVSNGLHPNMSVVEHTAYGSALAVTSFGRLELIVNGEKAAESECKDVGRQWVANIEHKISTEGWVAVRVLDTRKSFLDEKTPTFGHTSAQWIGDPKPSPEARAFLRDQLSKARDWVETHGRFDLPKSKTRLLATFDEAMAKLS
ncbi:MAG: hypothetical protein ACJ8C4_02995 [Gemmataceae bacterium]